VEFVVADCTPGELVTIGADWNVGTEHVRTEAQFIAPASGIVEPALMASVGGSYTGVDPFGLWWSVDLQDVSQATSSLEPWLESITASGRAWHGTRTLVRRKIDSAVRRIEVASGPLRGIAFMPAGAPPFPSVLMFSGSGGGLSSVQCSAALLASRGFATLALAYFNYADLPRELTNIPLEYFQMGIDWLTTNTLARGGRVAVMGASRGGELALLLGSTYPGRVAAVVAMVPSGLVWGGLQRDPGETSPAWTIDGQPVPQVQGEVGEGPALPLREGAVVYTPSFEAQLASNSPEALEAAEIPIENCAGPVLLISGEDDALWPSVALAEVAVRRGRTRGARFPVRHLRYPDAGHAFPRPAGFPVPTTETHAITGERLALGGTPAGNAHACADSWQQILKFLGANLPASDIPR
jgi:dienelactone hydrolase